MNEEQNINKPLKPAFLQGAVRLLRQRVDGEGGSLFNFR